MRNLTSVDVDEGAIYWYNVFTWMNKFGVLLEDVLQLFSGVHRPDTALFIVTFEQDVDGSHYLLFELEERCIVRNVEEPRCLIFQLICTWHNEEVDFIQEKMIFIQSWYREVKKIVFFDAAKILY